MNKKALTIIALSLFILAACAQKPIGPTTPLEDIETEEQKEPEQTCTEMWLCQNENTKAYRKSDCTFEQITDC